VVNVINVLNNWYIRTYFLVVTNDIRKSFLCCWFCFLNFYKGYSFAYYYFLYYLLPIWVSALHNFRVAGQIPVCLVCFDFHIDLYEPRLWVCACGECNKCNNAINACTLTHSLTQPHVFKCCPKHVFVASCGILAAL